MVNNVSGKELKNERMARREGCVKKSLPGKPLVTVVTVVFNAEDCLEKTIRSVIEQSYDNVEYIIIDGESSDATIEIIKRYESYITVWISEPDNGIYDAMNKGLFLAKGEWVNFLNAGDVFYSNETLQKLSEFCATGDLVYGHCNVEYADGYQRIRKARELNSLWQGMPFSHQSLITRTDLHRKHPYDVRRKLCADFDFVYKAHLRGDKFVNSNLIISTVSAGGISDCRRVDVMRECSKIVEGGSFNFTYKLYFRTYIIIEYLKFVVKFCIPDSMIRTLRKWRNWPNNV